MSSNTTSHGAGIHGDKHGIDTFPSKLMAPVPVGTVKCRGNAKCANAKKSVGTGERRAVEGYGDMHKA